jgi:hypothetical protein
MMHRPQEAIVNSNLMHELSVVRLDDMLREAARERQARAAARPWSSRVSALLHRKRSAPRTHPPVRPTPLFNG